MTQLWTQSIQITPEMLNAISRIDTFSGSWILTHSLTPERLDRMRRHATVESIASSTRIEGSQLSNRQVDFLLQNIEITQFTDRDSQEVAGYADAFDLIIASPESIPVTASSIRELHAMMMRYAEKDAWHRGGYKRVSNEVAAYDADGQMLGTVFKTADPSETPQRMDELIEWTRNETARGVLHPILIIGIFNVVFLEIHPFQDGNGRLSRLLLNLMLLQADYAFTPYSSLEAVIEDTKPAYYRALRLTQGTIRSDKPAWTPWFTYFLSSISTQISRLETRLESAQEVGETSPAVRVLEVIQDNDSASIGEIARITGVNRNTLKKLLAGMVGDGSITLTGAGRGARYSATDKQQTGTGQAH